VAMTGSYFRGDGIPYRPFKFSQEK